MEFDINDRTTWDWVEGPSIPSESAANESGYALDPTSKSHFYRFSNGVAVREACPRFSVDEGLTFDPRINPGPVGVPPHSISEAEIYEWAVGRGLVKDQR